MQMELIMRRELQGNAHAHARAAALPEQQQQQQQQLPSSLPPVLQLPPHVLQQQQQQQALAAADPNSDPANLIPLLEELLGGLYASQAAHAAAGVVGGPSLPLGMQLGSAASSLGSSTTHNGSHTHNNLSNGHGGIADAGHFPRQADLRVPTSPGSMPPHSAGQWGGPSPQQQQQQQMGVGSWGEPATAAMAAAWQHPQLIVPPGGFLDAAPSGASRRAGARLPGLPALEGDCF